MDIHTHGDNLVVELELPGVKESDLDISVERDHLVVTGTRKRSSEREENDRYFTERSYGGFHRVVHLPTSVDEEKVTATLKEGLLTITLPKAKEEIGKKVKVTKE